MFWQCKVRWRASKVVCRTWCQGISKVDNGGCLGKSKARGEQAGCSNYPLIPLFSAEGYGAKSQPGKTETHLGSFAKTFSKHARMYESCTYISKQEQARLRSKMVQKALRIPPGTIQIS
jgi:hypothetical protein